jgi:hypothetical protein
MRPSKPSPTGVLKGWPARRTVAPAAGWGSSGSVIYNQIAGGVTNPVYGSVPINHSAKLMAASRGRIVRLPCPRIKTIARTGVVSKAKG